MAAISPVKQITELNKRLERARVIFEQDHVSPVHGEEGVYIVQGPVNLYIVDTNGCACADAKFGRPLHRGYCKHRLAVCLYEEAIAELDQWADPDPGPDAYDVVLEDPLADLF